MSKINIKWPNGKISSEESGTLWIQAAINADVIIPSGCLSGSCGACEIDVNGEIVRACISNVPETKSKYLEVDFAIDPYW